MRDGIINELYMPLSSKIVLSRKKEMLYVPLDFENGLTIDALVDPGVYVCVVAQKKWDRIKQQAPSNILKSDDPPNFQIQVANGQLEKPIATTTLKFDIGDHNFAEHFVAMKNLTGPIIGLHFMRHNSVVIDTTHGPIHFPHLTMQVKSASSQTSAKAQTVLIHDSISIPQMTKKNNHIICWSPIGIENNRYRDPRGKIHRSRECDNIPFYLNSHWQKKAVRVTNTTKSPYTIQTNTQIADWSVLTPVQSKFIKPVDTAILSMIPEGDPVLITYLTKLLRTKKPDQQNNNLWFLTPEHSGKREDHTPIQTRTLKKELRELQQKEKLNPKIDA